MSTNTRNLQAIDGVNVSNPSANNFSANGLQAYADDAAFAADFTPVAGSIYWNTTEKLIREYNGTTWQYDKTYFLTATDSTTTGADQSITPGIAQMIRFTSNTLTSINNIVPTTQKVIYLANDQSTQAITIKYDTGGTVANRIRTGNLNDFVLKVNQIAGFIYDNINSRWRLVEKPITGVEAFVDDAAFVTAHAGVTAGDEYFNTTSQLMRQYNGTAWQNDKTSYTTQTDSTTTGSAQDITPAVDQIIRFTHGSLASIRGIIPTLQKVITLVNGQASQAITILNEDAGATAANRIFTGTGLDHVLIAGQALSITYDTGGSRWRITSTMSGVPLPIASGGTGQSTKTPAFDALSPLTTKGDLITRDASNNIRRSVGADGTVLTADSAQASGLNWTAPLTNPMTTAGDIIVGGVAGAAGRLAVGAAGTVLKGGSSPAYAAILNADVSASAAIAGTKISPDFGAQNIVTTGTVTGATLSSGRSNTGSIATGTPTTIFNASPAGRYEVAVWLTNTSGYSSFATIISSGNTFRLVANNDGNSSITMSGSNVQVTQVSGVSQTIQYSYAKVG